MSTLCCAYDARGSRPAAILCERWPRPSEKASPGAHKKPAPRGMPTRPGGIVRLRDYNIHRDVTTRATRSIGFSDPRGQGGAPAIGAHRCKAA